MVATRRLDCSLEPPREPRDGQVHTLPITPVAEQYSAAMRMRARHASPRLPVDPAEDGMVLNNFMTRFPSKQEWTHNEVPGGRQEDYHAHCGAK